MTCVVKFVLEINFELFLVAFRDSLIYYLLFILYDNNFTRILFTMIIYPKVSIRCIFSYFY